MANKYRTNLPHNAFENGFKTQFSKGLPPKNLSWRKVRVMYWYASMTSSLLKKDAPKPSRQKHGCFSKWVCSRHVIYQKPALAMYLFPPYASSSSRHCPPTHSTQSFPKSGIAKKGVAFPQQVPEARLLFPKARSPFSKAGSPS